MQLSKPTVRIENKYVPSLRFQHFSSPPATSFFWLNPLLPEAFADDNGLDKRAREALKAAFIRENEGLAELTGGAANREALSAFREKRDPDFSGL